MVAAIFGPWHGFLYSWLATMVSATLGFYIGRWSRGAFVGHMNPRLQRTSEILGERGIFASFIIRLIPSGPAVVVNMIAGASHMRLWQYALGTGLGIIPKTIAFAFFGGSIARMLRSGNFWELVAAAAALALWIVFGIWIRRRYPRTALQNRGVADFREFRARARPREDDGPVH